MTPAARVQAAIEILDLIVVAAANQGAPADRIVSEWFRTRRFAGSGDRRAVRELVYAAIRACGPLPQHGRSAMLLLAQDDPALTALFGTGGHGPPAIVDEPVAKGGIAPQWLVEALTASGIMSDEAAALLGRAALDLRVNSLKASRETISLPVPAQPTAARNGLRLPAGSPVETWPQFSEGLIEVQDSGSQLVCEAAEVQPGETVIDLCAGAGGKTLALGAAMDNRGVLLGCDTDRGRLQRLPQRAARAGLSIAETLLLNPNQEAAQVAGWNARADCVLIDAPCSGTGTWRRNPEARWRLTPKDLDRHVALQARLLDLAAPLVAPGGRLIYIVCSLLDREGADQVAAFLERTPGWRAQTPLLPAGKPRGAGLRLTPMVDDCDGFFVARLARV